MNCKKCGNQLTNDTVFCPMCGERQTVSSDNKQKKFNSKIIIFIIIGVLLVGFGIYIFQTVFKKSELSEQNNNSQLDNNDKTTEDEETIPSDDNIEEETEEEYTFDLFVPSKIEKVANNDNELTKNIVIEEIFFNPKYIDYGSSRKAYIYGKNNNKEAVTVKIIIEYYDSEGYRIERTTNTQVVFAGKEFVIDLYVESDSLDYTNVKLLYETSKMKSYQTEVDLNKIEINHYKIADERITVVVKNNSNTKIYFGNLACLYYKDNKLVFAMNSWANTIEPGETKTATFYDHQLNLGPKYNEKEKIEYDDYKIILYSAYDSDSTNY